MAIIIIPNQPILFRNTDEIAEDCSCNVQSFCQIINEIDPTQFQIGSDDLVTNGDFEDGNDGWNDIIPLDLVLEITNVSSEGECDGSVTITPTNGNAPYTYSLNGSPFQEENAFLDLCEGCYYATVKDTDGQEESIEFCVVINIICGDYSLTTDFVDVETIELANCYTTDFV